ncbi:MAG: pyruvate/2-oxoglutarate dehydrogenase complex dihydrolipoamide acyltransferase (E2) component [Myxococcota bacterium]|jgi:pyruvate/2-oxoglutarate dehydrogenase complex dihydrolipoamide acyltransferase (E2) component
MPNLALEKVKEVSSFRKLAIGTWRTVGDPSTYGSLNVEMDAAMDYLARFRAATGLRVTVSHMMAKVMAAALVRVPDANAILRFHRIYRRKRIGVFFQVVMTDEGEGKVDLSGATIYDVEQKSLHDVITEFETKVDLVRKRKDPALEKTRKTFSRVPFWFMGKLLKMVSWASFTMNWAVPGIPKDPFGSVMVTNVGSLGLDVAYAPLVPYSRVPMIMAIGAVEDTVVARDGEIVIRKMMKVSTTFDHRIIDGFHGAVISKVIRGWFSNPDKYFGPIPDMAPKALAGPDEQAISEWIRPALTDAESDSGGDIS